jgi:hypothetical protein
MSESARTLAYAGVAVTSIVVAGLYGWLSQPDRVEGFANVGKEFYPEFVDPSEADSLRVVAFNDETATISRFGIAQKSPGQWVIPTHYDYPADARDRLNRTANSIIGIKRGAQKASRESEHKELGVLDPLSEDGDLEGRGKRITLKKGDTVLADYIIGTKAGDEGNLYHVRVPTEKQVYLAEIDVDLSTKFGDWIEADLLKVDSSALKEVTVNKYSIDERRGAILDQEVNVLKKVDSKWTLDGLDEQTEEMKTSDVSAMVDALDDLKILGVRPKPKGLNADLTPDPEFVRNQMQYDSLRADLQGKGYFIFAGENNEPKLYANEGNVMAATEEGVVYSLNFGELFSGSAAEIEIGKDDDEDAEDEEPSMDDSNNRYLFVSVAFDEKYLGEKPIEPAKPTKPEGLVEKAPVEKQQEDVEPGEQGQEADSSPGDADGGCFVDQEEQEAKEDKKTEAATQQEADAKTEEANAATDAAQDAKPADATKEAAAQETAEPKKVEPKPESEEDKQKRLSAEWAASQRAYDAAMKTYESDLKAYEQKIKDGKKKVDDLNYRLGAWYYVISDDSFKTLRMARTDLVKPKEKKESPAGAGNPMGGFPGMGGLPGSKPPAMPAAKPAAKPAADEVEDKAPAKQPEPPATQPEPPATQPKADGSGSDAPKNDAAKADQKVDAGKEEPPAKKEAVKDPAKANGEPAKEKSGSDK